MGKLSATLLCTLALTMAAYATVPNFAEMPQSIASAKTADDHRRFGDYFASKAASYDAEAAAHEKMAASYAIRSSGGRNDMSSMRSHFISLRDGFVNAARDARALEQAHRHQVQMLGG